MTAIPVISDEDYSQGVPLDIEPLLSPYLQQGRLSIRIERLPSRSRLSKGRNNGDATFSLKPDELDGLAFLPAKDTDGSAVTLAVRIVKLDGDDATTLALIDLPVLSASESEQSAKPRIDAAERPRNGGRETSRKPARLTGGSLNKNGQALAGMPVDEQVETLKLQRAFDVLTKSLAETEARAEHAERKAEDAEARIAELESHAGNAGADPEGLRAEVSERYEKEFVELRQQLDTAAGDIEEAHKQALKTAETSHSHELEQTVTSAKQQLAQEYDGRLAKALREAEGKAVAHLEKARQTWESDAQTALSSARESWKSEEAQRLAAAKQAFEAELSDLRERFTAATDDIETARKKATEISETSRARAIAELRTAHARSLEEDTAAAKAELERALEGRLAETRREAEQAAEERLCEERKRWQADAGNVLSQAKDAWQAEAAQRLAGAKTAHESELSELHQQLDAATDESAKVREQSSSNDEMGHAREIEELRRTHASDLKEKVAAAKKQLEQAFDDRLAGATAGHEMELSDLRTQLKVVTGEMEELRKQESEVGQPAAATIVRPDKASEDRLAEERKVWVANAEATLARARANWKTAEEERLAAAMKAWQRGLRVEGKPGRGRRLSGRLRFNFWMPRRSLVITAAIVFLFALPVLHPDTKFLVLEYGVPAFTKIKSRVTQLLNPEPVVVQPPQPGATAPVETRAIVGVQSANVRTGPSTATSVVGSLLRGSSVIVLGSQGDWLHVRFGVGANRVGWVHRDLLSGTAR